MFAFFYNAVGAVKHICTADFGYIVSLGTKLAHAFMPGHVHTQNAAFGVLFYKIKYGSFFHDPSTAFEASSIMAHSMRFLKSVHPYSYMPVTEPDAW